MLGVKQHRRGETAQHRVPALPSTFLRLWEASAVPLQVVPAPTPPHPPLLSKQASVGVWIGLWVVGRWPEEKHKKDAGLALGLRRSLSGCEAGTPTPKAGGEHPAAAARGRRVLMLRIQSTPPPGTPPLLQSLLWALGPWHRLGASGVFSLHCHS